MRSDAGDELVGSLSASRYLAGSVSVTVSVFVSVSVSVWRLVSDSV